MKILAPLGVRASAVANAFRPASDFALRASTVAEAMADKTTDKMADMQESIAAVAVGVAGTTP